jgi:FixJ family two-component response regulator
MIADALVLVLDDDRSVRASLSRAVRSAGHAVEAFGDANALLARLASVGVPCCILSDVRMPGMDGLALQQELRASGAPASIVFLTGFADVPLAVRAIKGGAVDLLQKPVSRDVLLASVATALERAREELERRRRMNELHARYRTLTAREREVFALVTAGLLNKQVGYELGTSEKTVKVQRARVVEKMRARSLPDLVRMADRLDVHPPAVAAANPAAPPGYEPCAAA